MYQLRLEVKRAAVEPVATVEATAGDAAGRHGLAPEGPEHSRVDLGFLDFYAAQSVIQRLA